MRIKEIKAETVSAALSKVQKELGAGAVILSTKIIKGMDGGVIVTAGHPGADEEVKPQSKKPKLDQVVGELRGEIDQIYETLATGQAPLEYLPPGIEDLTRRLRNNGVSPRLRRRIVDMTMRLGTGAEVLAHATGVIGDLIPIYPLKGFVERPRILSFVGPTGVGKTTTIAKLAGRLVHEANKKVALLSLDTYRVAAVEQLRAYADMLSMPLQVLFTPSDAARAFQEYKDYDVILVDTAGRSPYDAARLQELAGFVRYGQGLETMLVISATTAANMAEEIVDRFMVTGPAGIVLSKLDETKQPGALLELFVMRDLPLAYMAFGQEVPSDIERASAEDVANRILFEHKEPTTNVEAQL